MFTSSVHKRLAVLFLFLGAAGFCGNPVLAHEVRPSLLKLSEYEPGRWQVVFKQPQVQGRFQNLKAVTNCQAGEVRQQISGTALQESFELDCDAEGLTVIRIEGLDRTLSDTMVTLNPINGDTRNHLISSNNTTLTLDSTDPGIPAYLLLGIEHLLFGIDHVLFVLVLLTIVTGWRNLLKVITSFTVAHSITLGLAATDIVSLSQRPVEALIALSIVLLARESVEKKKGLLSHNPWIVAFAFGLLHGLGFASALAEIGLPQAGAVFALLLFNVGIELGQLMIIAGALCAVLLMRRMSGEIKRQFTVVCLYLLGGVASYWFLDRAWLILA